MACYSDACKRRSSKCVLIVGGLLFLFGVITIIVGFGLGGGDEVKMLTESEWFKKTGIEIDIAGVFS